MVCMCKCSIMILFLLIQLQSSYVFKDTDSATLIASNFIENIRNLKNKNSGLLWFQQRPIINEKLIGNIDDILVSPVTKKNLDNIWSTIYVSLGCYCSQTIRSMLNNKFLNILMVHKINLIILKIISIMIDIMGRAPNVVSLEPGILKLSLWLNLYMHKVFIKMKNEDSIFTDSNTDTERMFLKMANFIERFMISNCQLDTNNQTNTISWEELSNDINITLSNIEFPNNMISDYRLSFEEDHPHNLKFSIIIDCVLKELVNNQILVRPLDVTKTILDIKYDVEDILSYMDLVFDGIIKIFCQILINFLKLFSKLKKKSKDLLITAIYSWSKNDIITKYKTQISYLKSMQFPMRLIVIVEFGLRIVHDVIHYKKISNLNVVEKKILQEFNNVEIKLSSPNSEMPRLEFMKFNGCLITFLDVLGSIDAFKYFNLIFKLKQNYDPVVRDLTETILSKMEYETSNNQTKKMCQQVQLLYVLCNDVISKIKKSGMTKKSLKDKSYPNIQNLSTAIRNIMPLSNKSNLTAVLSLASEYLERNMLIDLNADKMKPIPYFTMNLLDMFQIHGCRDPVYRAMALKKMSVNITKYFKFNFGKVSQSEISPFSKLLKKDYVEMFYRSDSQNLLRFYWKGQLQTFNEIVEIVTCSGNPLDHPSFVRYVNVFQIFIVSTLFCEIIYTLDYSLANYATYITVWQNEMFIKSAKSLKFFDLPECFVPATEALNEVEDFKDSVTLIENKIMLKQNLALCGLCHLPNTIVTVYDWQREVLFNEFSSILNEYYNSVLSLQDSDPYKNHHVNKLDTYMKLTFGNFRYPLSIHDIDDIKFSKSEAVEIMLEDILLKDPLSATSDNTDCSTVVIS